MKTIAIITGTRAEYGLLRRLALLIKQSALFKLQLIVTGTHLVPQYGQTIQEIINDDLEITYKLDMLLASNTNHSVAKSMGIASMGFADAFDFLKPDLVILLGDRYEILSAASTALLLKIPIAHIHGGEVTEGAIDDSIRHAVTKMAHLHFTATEKYKQRIIQMGEQPENVFNVGGMGIDAIRSINIMQKEELEKSIDFKLGDRNITVTFHPETLHELDLISQIQPLMDSLRAYLDKYNGTVIFTMPNADAGSQIIIEEIRKFCNIHSDSCRLYNSLGQRKYYSLLSHTDAVIGNSSSGILEMPCFKKASINIGGRQKGRIFADSILQTENSKESIFEAIEKVYDVDFINKLSNSDHPYGDGRASEKILKVIEKFFSYTMKNKVFRDLEFDY